MEIGLVIEIDGGYHNVEQQREYDQARTNYLKEFGFDILRFTKRGFAGRRNGNNENKKRDYSQKTIKGKNCEFSPSPQVPSSARVPPSPGGEGVRGMRRH